MAAQSSWALYRQPPLSDELTASEEVDQAAIPQAIHCLVAGGQRL